MRERFFTDVLLATAAGRPTAPDRGLAVETTGDMTATDDVTAMTDAVAEEELDVGLDVR